MATRKSTKKTAVKKAGPASQAGHNPSAPRAKEEIKKTVPANGKTAAKKTPAFASAPAKALSNPVRDEKLQEIRIILIQQKESLLSEAEVALNELPGGQTMFPDMGDQASAETDMNFMLRLRGREQRLLKKIDEALERIDSGTFGICDDCGNEIDFKRLQARPVTTMCIECKTLQEEEEKRREP